MRMVKVKDLKSFWGKQALEGEVEHTATDPILISSDGYIVDGHKRTRRAKQDGVEEIPAIFLEFTFKETEPLRVLDGELKKLKLWDLCKLYKKATRVR